MARPVLALFAAAVPGVAAAAGLPAAVSRQLPPGYRVITRASAAADAGSITIVALARTSETARSPTPAPARPLLLFARQQNGSYRQVGRNDHVVMRADEGGQCDPFEDGGAVIAVKGRYFTVENGVACGQHWTDFITFRHDANLGRYVFDNERTQSWSLNPSNNPDAEALVPDGPPRVRRGRADKSVLFDDGRPARD